MRVLTEREVGAVRGTFSGATWPSVVVVVVPETIGGPHECDRSHFFFSALTMRCLCGSKGGKSRKEQRGDGRVTHFGYIVRRVMNEEGKGVNA